MKVFAIDFKALNAKKEVITCTSLINAETLFLAIHAFEEKNRGLGYIVTSVREENNHELSALKSLRANVHFWFQECGLSSSIGIKTPKRLKKHHKTDVSSTPLLLI